MALDNFSFSNYIFHLLDLKHKFPKSEVSTVNPLFLPAVVQTLLFPDGQNQVITMYT